MRRTQCGAILLLLLLWSAIAAALLALTTEVYSESVLRERRQELLRVGDEYRRGIASYFFGSPGTVMHLPARLDDLVSDSRMLVITRHVRKIYRDPMAPDTTSWGLVRLRDVPGWSPPQGDPRSATRTYAVEPDAIVGVFSRAWPPNPGELFSTGDRKSPPARGGGPLFLFGVSAGLNAQRTALPQR